jgi:bifunctional UDP-N-acetylglucosamine pyrophosphorylase/glucosamine-1-phosphate N-acetyltransferase
MTAAFIDGGRAAAAPRLFRGRDLAFWIERSFPFCRFAAGSVSGRDGEMVLVFSGGLLPVLSVAGRRELRAWLRAGDRRPAGLFAPVDKPFFAVSRSYLKRSGLRLEPGVFRRLRALPGAGELSLKYPLAALDPVVDPLAVEAVVLGLQIEWLDHGGVIVDDHGHFFVEGLPAIGRGSRLGPGTVIRGDCRIGRDVRIHPHCLIENSRIGDGCVLLPGSVVLDSRIGKNAQLGPFCHVRLGSLVGAGAKVGNFVEMKKSRFGRGSKAMHLSYIGDATVGRKVNVGAGTITCNYDGSKKNPTRIGDNVFIGSGTELVAPVTVQSDSYVAAGSTITEDVPRHALAVARQRQRNIKDWVLRKQAKKK